MFLSPPFLVESEAICQFFSQATVSLRQIRFQNAKRKSREYEKTKILSACVRGILGTGAEGDRLIKTYKKTLFLTLANHESTAIHSY